MPHHTPLIGTIVVGLVLAFALGAVANRMRLSPIIGYLLNSSIDPYAAYWAAALSLLLLGLIWLLPKSDSFPCN